MNTSKNNTPKDEPKETSKDGLLKYIRTVINAPTPKAIKNAQLSVLVKNGELSQAELNNLLSAK